MIKEIAKPLSQIQLQQLDLQRTYYTQKTSAPFPVRPLFLKALLILGCLVALFLSAGLGIAWIFITVMLFTALMMWNQVGNYRRNKRQAHAMIAKIQQLLTRGEIRITECTCKRAIHFPITYEDGFYFLMEVDEKKLLGFVVYYDEINPKLPNTHFSFYTDELTRELLGREIFTPGQPVEAIKLHGQIKVDLGHQADLFPDHLETINYSIEAYLDLLKEKLEQATLY